MRTSNQRQTCPHACVSGSDRLPCPCAMMSRTSHRPFPLGRDEIWEVRGGGLRGGFKVPDKSTEFRQNLEPVEDSFFQCCFRTRPTRGIQSVRLLARRGAITDIKVGFTPSINRLPSPYSDGI